MYDLYRLYYVLSIPEGWGLSHLFFPPFFLNHFIITSLVLSLLTLTCLMQIDEDILQEVVKMGFDRNQLSESLRNRVQNEV